VRIKYIDKKFQPKTLEMIEQASAICSQYDGALTLRQLYYQFVSLNLFANDDRNYDRLQSAIADARMAGKFDWDYIIDRTRNLVSDPTWESPATLIKAAADQFRADLWAPQKKRVEVWIEKDAAIGTVERICRLNQVPYFSCRGYTSSSEMWAAGTRIGEYLRNGEQTVILHIGDHDPSGWDMSRDIEDRLRTFIHQDWVNEFGFTHGNSRGGIRSSMREVMREAGSEIGDADLPWEVRRIALTLEQVEMYNPPPNPVKKTDDRFQRYFEATGLEESWELDALRPDVVEELIQDHVDSIKDDAALAKAELKQEQDRVVLKNIHENWELVRAQYGNKETK